MGSNKVAEVILPPGTNGDTKSPLAFQISKEFLQFAFEKKVQSFKVKLGSNPGDNYMSIMHAVEVIFQGELEAKHYLIKCYPNHPTRREMLDRSHVFEKELFMYQNFLPKLAKLAKESTAASDGIVGMSIAPFHGGNVGCSPSKKWRGTQWANENFIIMTDLRKYQYSMADRTAGLNMEQATIVVQELARWHALAWAHKEQNGWSMLSDKYPNLVDPLYSNDEVAKDFKVIIDQVNKSVVKMTEEILGDDHPAHLALIRATEGDPIRNIKKFVTPQDTSEDDYESMLRVKPEADEQYNKEPWLTGAHGDCWMNNMLFRYDPQDQTRPVEVTFIDLQMYRETCPTVDLAFFFSTSVRAAIRIPGKDKLLQAYHDAFILSCGELNVKPYPGFSLNSLKRRYRRSELFGVLLGFTLLTFILKPAEEAFDLDEEKNEKEFVSEMFSKVMVGADKNAKFKEELISTVLNLYETGVI